MVGSGGAVFDNVTVEEITDAEIAAFDRIYNGVDWGFYPDPWAFNRMHYDAARRTLYIFGELTRHRTGQCGNGKASAAIWCAGYGFDYGGQCRAEKCCGLSLLWAVLPWRSEGTGECGLLYEVATGFGADCD